MLHCVQYDSYPSNGINRKVFEFINLLTFDGYILAGNSVSNILNEIELQGDLDFWINDRDTYIKTINEFLQYYNVAHIYPSMVEMINTTSNLPRINIVFTLLNPNDTINSFDMDYCRCYIDNTRKIYATSECLASLRSKIIMSPKHLQPHRLVKALKYGYMFNACGFKPYLWMINDEKFKQICNLYTETLDISVNDIKSYLMEESTLKLVIKNIFDVNYTLHKLVLQLKLLTQSTIKFRKPLLILDTTEKLLMLNDYVKNIVLKNPAYSAAYDTIHLGKFCVNFDNIQMFADGTPFIKSEKTDKSDDEKVLSKVEYCSSDDEII